MFCSFQPIVEQNWSLDLMEINENWRVEKLKIWMKGKFITFHIHGFLDLIAFWVKLVLLILHDKISFFFSIKNILSVFFHWQNVETKNITEHTIRKRVMKFSFCFTIIILIFFFICYDTIAREARLSFKDPTQLNEVSTRTELMSREKKGKLENFSLSSINWYW